MSTTMAEAAASGPAATGHSALARRIEAVQSVSDTASRQAAKLEGHVRQMNSLLARIAGQLRSAPRPEKLDRLTERMNSLQTMLDWATTRPLAPTVRTSPPVLGERDLSAIQARLSKGRLTLMGLQAQIQHSVALRQDLAEVREGVASLADDLTALASIRQKAGALSEEARDLALQLEAPGDPSADVDGARGEIRAGQEAE
jgi:predicted  nucleic acid-binding Zn-ribbon protein